MAFTRITLALAATLLVACGSSTSSPNAPAPVAEGDGDERGSIGVPNPAADYCEAAGFTYVDDQCHFTDGTSCEAWQFFYAECGQSHSYCAQHGGQIANVPVDEGTWTGIKAVCTLNGKACDEPAFVKSGTCD